MNRVLESELHGHQLIYQSLRLFSNRLLKTPPATAASLPHSFCGLGVWLQLHWPSSPVLEGVVSEVLRGWTASGFTYLVFGRIWFPEGCWLKLTLSSWPCGPLHGAVHIRVGEPGRRDRQKEREIERERQASKTNRSLLRPNLGLEDLGTR